MGPPARASAGSPRRRPGRGRPDHPGRRARRAPRQTSPRSAPMSPHLARYIDAFAGLRVLVIGEAMLDSYLEGTTGRLCREAPVPIVALTGRRDAPGGAANTAANARALGARVSFLSVAGEDPEGALLRRALDDRGVYTDGLL